MNSEFFDDFKELMNEILSPDRDADFSGTGWVLTSLNGEPPLEGTTITLEFLDDGKVAGSSGCNRYTSTYSYDAGSKALAFGSAAGTMMACPTPVMEQERKYLQILEATSSFDVEEQTLSFVAADGMTLAEFSYVSQALAGSSWDVTGYNNGKGGVVSVLGGTSLTAVFDDERVSGSSGCNTFSGTYAVDGDGISFGPLAGTRKMCFGEGVMEQEGLFLQALESAGTFRISGNKMELRREDGALAVNLRRA